MLFESTMKIEGIEDVRLGKIAFLIGHYENFNMKEGETVDEMFRRFQTILNDGLGKVAL